MDNKIISELLEKYPVLNTCKQSIISATGEIIESFIKGGKLLIAGNGGSAADSDHISGELIKSFVKKRKLEKDFFNMISKVDEDSGVYLFDKLQGALPAIALTNNIAAMTACLNDVDGNMVFAQQVMGLGQKNDIFLGISTSGNSKDIIYAMVVAKAKGLKTIALSGRDGGKLKNIADVSIIVPEWETYKIQELHLPIYHAICLKIEEHFWKE